MKILTKILMFDREGSLLVLRRSGTHPQFALHLDFPGGEIDNNEDPITALRREVFEETSLTLEKAKLLFRENLPKDNAAIYLFKTILKTSKPPITMSWEHDRAEWISVDELLSRSLPKNVSQDFLVGLSYLKKGHSESGITG